MRTIPHDSLGFPVDAVRLQRQARRFKTVEVVGLGDGNALIRPTLLMRASPLICIAVGLVFGAIVRWYGATRGSWHLEAAAVSVMLLGIGLLSAFGLWMPKPTYIDKDSGYLFLGASRRQSPSSPRAIEIKNIAALQVIVSVYMEYEYGELNLVLQDPPGKRIPLFAHGNRLAFNADLERLTTVLDKPVLEAS